MMIRAKTPSMTRAQVEGSRTKLPSPETDLVKLALIVSRLKFHKFSKVAVEVFESWPQELTIERLLIFKYKIPS